MRFDAVQKFTGNVIFARWDDRLGGKLDSVGLGEINRFGMTVEVAKQIKADTHMATIWHLEAEHYRKLIPFRYLRVHAGMRSASSQDFLLVGNEIVESTSCWKM